MDGYIKIGTEIDTTDFDAEIRYIENQMEEIEHKLKQADMGFEVGDVNKLEAQYSRLSKQLVKMVAKQNELGKTDFSGLKNSIDDIGNSVSKTVRKVGQWALAIFGIRSAYLAVRGAMSTLSQYDDQMAVNVEYIRYALANALKPVIETLINLAYKLLTYTNYIAKAWFGVDLFAKSSSKSFNEAKNGLKGATKQAKELNKQLAGFDEMNILQENGSTTAGGGGGGTPLPTFDLATPEDIPIPGWIKWIGDNGDKIIAILTGIATSLTLLKFGLSGIKSLGIGIAITGIILLIEDVIKFIKDPSWGKFISILGDIAIAIGGIMIATGNWWGLFIVIIGGIVKLVAENWDKIKDILIGVAQWIINNVVTPVINIFGTIWNSLINGAKNAYNGVKTAFSGLANFFKTIFTKAWNNVKAVFSTGGKVFTGIKDGILSSFKKIVNTLIDGINKVVKIPFDGINNSLKAIKNINILGKKPFKGLIGTISVPKIPHLAKGGIINMPGRGIPIGNAIAGEKGKEGVIPLTDSQQMALLGEAIGKYININATIPVYVGNRQVARELQKINTQSDFAFNR